MNSNDSYLQRITYSSYYGGGIAKGGVFIQPCGWIGIFEFYPGSILDSDYLHKMGIFEKQKWFQNADRGDSFIDVLDGGYTY